MVTQGLLTVGEAAEKLGLNPETIRRWIWGKKLPAEKLGLIWYIKPEDLDKKRAVQG
jgi:excisionase family DNA binding protein